MSRPGRTTPWRFQACEAPPLTRSKQTFQHLTVTDNPENTTFPHFSAHRLEGAGRRRAGCLQTCEELSLRGGQECPKCPQDDSSQLMKALSFVENFIFLWPVGSSCCAGRFPAAVRGLSSPSTGSRGSGTDSGAAVPGPRSSGHVGSPRPRDRARLLHWQAGSLPLSHRRGPRRSLLTAETFAGLCFRNRESSASDGGCWATRRARLESLLSLRWRTPGSSRAPSDSKC